MGKYSSERSDWLIYSLIFDKPPFQLDELIVKGMGTDFLFLLLQKGIHASSVVLVLKLLTKLLRDPSSLFATKFRCVNR